MCPRDPKATPNIRLSDDYNITSIVKFLSKYWYFSQVSVKADFHRTITIRSLEFAFLQSVMCDHNQISFRQVALCHVTDELIEIVSSFESEYFIL